MVFFFFYVKHRNATSSCTNTSTCTWYGMYNRYKALLCSLGEVLRYIPMVSLKICARMYYTYEHIRAPTYIIYFVHNIRVCRILIYQADIRLFYINTRILAYGYTCAVAASRQKLKRLRNIRKYYTREEFN